MKKRWIWVLVLALCLSACRQPPERPTPSVEVTPESTEMPVELPVFSDPITAFYDTLVYDESYACTPFYAFLVGQEAIAWEAEARHIFTYLKENAHPRLESGYLGLNLEQFEADFFDYVEKQSLLDAYIDYTSLLGEEGGTRGEFINYGTGFGAGEMLARIDHYRYFVESWYDNFTWLKDETPLDWYVFSPEEALVRLTEGNGLKFAQGEYLLEEQGEPEGERPLENPIDGWVSQWLYQDGTTSAMIADAWTGAKIWEAELSHVYEVFLTHANPAAELETSVERAREALLQFAPVNGECLALSSYSNAFMGKDQKDDFSAGSQARVDNGSHCADYYRHETLRLWQKILDRIGRDKLTWVFDPGEYETDLPLSRNPELADREREELRNLENGEDVSLWFDEERIPFERLLDYTSYNRLSHPPEEVSRYARRHTEKAGLELFVQDDYGGQASVLLSDETGEVQEFSMELELGFGGIGELLSEDLNFDGCDDLRIFIGGNRGGQMYYAAFVKDPETQRYQYTPGFSDISDPHFDYEHQVIWGGSEFLFEYSYSAFEYLDGDFVNTHRLVGDYPGAWENGAQCTEYMWKDGKDVIVGQTHFPGQDVIGAAEEYVKAGPVWEGWHWCDIRAYMMKG